MLVPAHGQQRGDWDSFWPRDDLAAGAAHALCNAWDRAAQHPRTRLDVEQRGWHGHRSQLIPTAHGLRGKIHRASGSRKTESSDIYKAEG